MASLQCKKVVHVHETTTCQQKCQASLGQKMSNWVKGSNQAQDQVKPMYSNHHENKPKPMSSCHGPQQAKAHSQPHHRPTHQQAHPAKPKAHYGTACQCVGKAKGSHGLQQAANGCATCHSNSNAPVGGRSFFGRIKDRMSGSGSDSDSSDSDNDECCRKRKN